MNRYTETCKLGLASALCLTLAWATSAQAQIALDGDDVGGVVTSTNGPEAGVWVIAETEDFDTFYAKIVVTDDQGRYVVPDLPDADYNVWVRGYGLADSEPVAANPGDTVNLDAIVAPSAAVAAEAYPAISWYAMMNLPTDDELANLDGGLNRYRNGMTNNGCVGCHQIGNLTTRTLSEKLGDFESHEQAWIRRVQSGQAGTNMMRQFTDLQGIPFKHYADWTQRIEDGELPTFIPERPQGLERNIVATVRDWSDEKAYLHDLISTDRRDPTVNGLSLIHI